MAAVATMKLKIKCLKSDDFEVEIDKEASVDDLKEEIQKSQNIEITKQRLIYKGRVLKSEKKLKDYKISDGVTVHLIKRKQATQNPQNDEPTPQNSTISNNGPPAPNVGQTSISSVLALKIHKNHNYHLIIILAHFYNKHVNNYKINRCRRC